MLKSAFFSVFFKSYINYIDSVKSIVVYEDESATDATIYFFKEDKLSEIEFGSFNY